MEQGAAPTVRRAGTHDAASLAALRLAWRAGEEGEAGMAPASFLASFVGWVEEHAGSHLGFVATAGDEPVGMAFLAVIERIPGPGRWQRLAGLLQGVYVRPERRGSGLGTRLCEAAIDEARRRGLDYLMVHPSARSFPLYRRLGFTGTGSLLQLELDQAGGGTVEAESQSR